GHLDVAAELGHEVRRRHGERGLGHLLQVAAGAERLLAGPGEHQDLRGVVLVEAPDPGPQTLPHRGVERVASFRPLDGEPGDAVLDPVADSLLDVLSAMDGGDSSCTAHAAPRWVPASLIAATASDGL